MSLLHLLAVVLISTTHTVISHKTYDLLRYSDIDVYKTTSKQENPTCKRQGLLYDCLSATDTSSEFKTDIINGGKSYDIVYDGHTKEVRFDVKFRRTYVVNNLLLSFREAKNISAISVEVWSDAVLVHSVQYGISQMVCDFFFADESSTTHVLGCHVKTDLSRGIMGYFNPKVVGDQVVVRLFPPIVNDYDVTRFYAVNHFFVGGSCRCRHPMVRSCRILKEDDVRLNDGLRNVLTCDVDRAQLTEQKSSVVRRRRSLPGLNDGILPGMNGASNECTCSKHGTLYSLCKPFIEITQQCPCKSNYVGISCDRCAETFVKYPTCRPCGCNNIGSMSTSCDVTTGQCKCEPRYSGLRCNKCAPGRYNFPFCYPCPCARDRTVIPMCDQETGVCVCSQRYDGVRCNRCRQPFVNFPVSYFRPSYFEKPKVFLREFPG